MTAAEPANRSTPSEPPPPIHSATLPGHAPCPSCGAHLDAISGQRRPSPGDICSRGYCGHLRIFDADGLPREMTDAEFEAIPDEAIRALAALPPEPPYLPPASAPVNPAPDPADPLTEGEAL